MNTEVLWGYRQVLQAEISQGYRRPHSACRLVGLIERVRVGVRDGEANQECVCSYTIHEHSP
jgi:hypothetical protein